MLSKILSAAISGVEAMPVIVETDIAKGMPAFHIVGQADTTIKESTERIRSALLNAGMEYPMSRITVNMSPADLRKRGSHFDLPVAVGILASSGQIFGGELNLYGFAGELSLDGSLNKTDGILPMVIALKKAGCSRVIIPYANRREAMLVRGIRIYPARNLEEVTDFFNLKRELDYLYDEEIGGLGESRIYTQDFADVKGQEIAKRAITIAVAGGHGILMMGSPSTGKTMLSERIPTIMPEMTFDEILETTVLYSIAGLLDENTPYITKRPFRQPHHKITPMGLLGGGCWPRPGEISLASKGVLFLDEAGEFDRNMIDALRTPLEKKYISIIRKGKNFLFPADFMLVAATNPCKCGYYGDPEHECTCSIQEVMRYQKKLSGPILDRIDMHIRLMPVDFNDLEVEQSLSTAEMKASIEAARRIQRERYAGIGITLNQQLDAHLAELYCHVDSDGKQILKMAYERLKLNPRTLLKVKKIARTIADLDGSENVEVGHINEALQYREKK